MYMFIIDFFYDLMIYSFLILAVSVLNTHINYDGIC